MPRSLPEWLILRGLGPDEGIATLWLAHAIATARYERGRDFPVEGGIWNGMLGLGLRLLLQGRYNRLLYGAGVVLCPIFDPVKHRTSKAYRSGMKELRLGIRSLSNEDVRAIFSERIRRADEVEALNSPTTADERRLWEMLGGPTTTSTAG